MKKTNLFKSALSTFVASMMVCTAMLPATASEVGVDECTEGMKYYFMEQLGEEKDNKCQIVFLVDSDKFRAAMDDLSNYKWNDETEEFESPSSLSYPERVKMITDEIGTYSFEDSLHCVITQSVFGWALGAISEEEMESIIQTAAEGGAIPVDKLELTLTYEFLDHFATAFIPPVEFEPAHTFEEMSDRLSYYIEKYDAVDRIRFATCIFDQDFSEAEVSFQNASISGAAGAEFLKALISGSGDINGNSEADLTDAVLLARAIGGTYELSAASRREADLNGDLNVDQNDLNALLRVLAGA